MKKFFILLLIIAIERPSFFLLSQTNKYFIAFKNKDNNGYSISNPSAFLSAKAIQRRTNQGIPIDATDLPVTPSYVNQIESLNGVTVLHRIKWLNGVIIQTTNTVALSVIQSYTYVQSAQPLNYSISQEPIDSVRFFEGSFTAKTYSYNYGNSYDQIHQLNVECLHNAGYKGEGMIIAVIDAGFYNVHNNPVFDSLFLQGRLLGTRDLVMRDTMVFEDDNHGAFVLSTMAALSPGNMVGTAPKASYWLLRSEDVNSEYPIEEYYWIRATEFADSVGADVINTSLGYTTFDNAVYNHSYSNLDGQTTPIAIGARMAARKGILVVVAAGNEGSGFWYYISTPADADSVCTVGAVDNTGTIASFSGHGPTADGRIKPDVCARGVSTIVSSAGGFPITGNGTSFAAPLMAGAMTCLWQAKNNLNNIQIINLVKQNSNNTANPNNSIGWGIPDFCGALTSVKAFEKDTLVRIYPNPTHDDINITSAQSIQSLKIWNAPGEVLLNYENINTRQMRVSVKDYPTGIYFISIIYSSGSQMFYKLLKH